MIEVKNLTKRYGQNLALDRVSFKIEEGTIVGFLGPNGAGKSTAMNIITGYLSATSGEVTVSGKNTLEEPNEVKKMIGYLPELPPLYMDMTVKEYLNFMYELKKAKLPREKHLKEICQLVKIENVYNRLIGNLSKGYKQRVGIAQALIGNPPGCSFWTSPPWAWTPSRSSRSAPSSKTWAATTRSSSAPTSCPRCRPCASASSSSTTAALWPTAPLTPWPTTSLPTTG